MPDLSFMRHEEHRNIEAERQCLGVRVEECIFCDLQTSRARRIIAENSLFFAVPDQYPVSRGHTLVLPKRHLTTLADLDSKEMSALGEILKAVREKLREELDPDGYNIGVNEGEAAGQTIPHLHIHVIPRFAGDVDEPRGGIRNIKKALIPY